MPTSPISADGPFIHPLSPDAAEKAKEKLINRKTFRDSPYTNADADNLLSKSKYDLLKDEAGKPVQLDSIDDAKEYIGKAVRDRQEVARLNKYGATRSLNDWGDGEMRAFKLGGFTMKDVKIAKERMPWLSDANPIQVKQYLGLKLINGPQMYDMLREYGIHVPGEPKNGAPIPAGEEGEYALKAATAQGFTAAQVQKIVEANKDTFKKYTPSVQTAIAAEFLIEAYKTIEGRKGLEKDFGIKSKLQIDEMHF